MSKHQIEPGRMRTGGAKEQTDTPRPATKPQPRYSQNSSRELAWRRGYKEGRQEAEAEMVHKDILLRRALRMLEVVSPRAEIVDVIRAEIEPK